MTADVVLMGACDSCGESARLQEIGNGCLRPWRVCSACIAADAAADDDDTAYPMHVEGA